MNQSELLYRGSVKDLYRVQTNDAGDELIRFVFSDRYSVFDWGAMPDEIPGKGKALTSMAEWFFKKVSSKESWQNLQASVTNLEDPQLNHAWQHVLNTGIKTHFVKRDSETSIVVRSFPVHRPRPVSVLGKKLYDYRTTHKEGARFLPLEVVFRMGMPSGSSLKKRLNSEYAQDLGFTKIPQDNEYFSKPVIEFFSKLEDTDRFLSRNEAFTISGLEASAFENLIQSTQLVAILLKHEFEKMGLELWDGKIEWAWDGPNLVLVDSIGPDEMRLIEKQTRVHISKEILRDYYRDTAWYRAVENAKTKIQVGQDWRDELKINQKINPEPLPKDLLKLVAEMYATAEEGKAYYSIAERLQRCLQFYRSH